MNNKYFHSIALIPMLISLGSCAQIPLKTKSVYMYKNGYAYVVKEGNVPLSNGSWTLKETDIPRASFGSIWFQSSSGISHVTAKTDTVEAFMYLPGIFNLLKANVGKEVSIHLINEKSPVKGIIQRVFELPFGQTQYDQRYSNTALAVIKTDTGSKVIYGNSASAIAFSEFSNDAVFDTYYKKLERKLIVNFNTSAASADLSFVYLQAHSAWAPSYRLILEKGNKARLTFGAEISAGDIAMQNTPLNLVVGDPYFSHGHIKSQLLNFDEADLVYPSQSVDASMNEQGASKGRWSFGEGSAAANTQDWTVQSGNNAEDFYIYTIKDVSMTKNSRAWIKILELNVNVEHIYTSTLPDFSEGSLPTEQLEPGPGSYQAVFHKLKFKNTADQPLSSGPVFIESTEGQTANQTVAIGQVNMETVPKGNETYISIAQSMDLPLVISDVESARTANAKSVTSRYGGVSHYDLLSMKSSLVIENKSDKEVKMKVYRTISGKMGSSDSPWELRTVKPNIYAYNDKNYVSWEISLKAGEKKTVNYNFEYYILSGN